MLERRLQGIGMTSQRTRERLVSRLMEKGIADPRVLDAIRHLPRHIFVDEALASRAYEDTALPIGHSQTISQPFIVARMTEILLQDEPGKVLEVGTGSGYQAAVLGKVVETVFGVERIGPLLRKARDRLRELRLHNVHTRLADGNWGWPENAPYDAILVAAAPTEIPEALLHQLGDGGQLIIPVGASGNQRLISVRRKGSAFVREELDVVSFVPLVSGVSQ
jgi:protein-L-isoaspartate(D-aspartate) O-methyltransferase